MATTNSSKRRVEQGRCSSIRIEVVVSRERFDISHLAKVIPIEKSELESRTFSGPLRLGGRGHEAFRLSGTTAFYQSPQPHYHFIVTGTAIPKRAPDRSAPSVLDFFAAIAKGIKAGPSTLVSIVGHHVYPPDWWLGEPLPVPLPPRDGQETGATLSGIEVSYENDPIPNRLSVSAGDDAFYVVTIVYLDNVSRELFQTAVERAEALAARMFMDPSKHSEKADV